MGLGDTVNLNNDTQEKEQPQPYVPLHVSVDMGDQSMGKAGASLSSRLRLGYVNEHGEIIRGFFTTNEYADPVKVFGSRFSTAMANPLYKDLQSLYAALENYVAVNTPEDLADGLFGCFDFRYLKKFNSYEEEKRFDERVNAFSLSYPPGPKEKESVEKFAQLLLNNGADAELVNSSKDSAAFLSFCRDILAAAHSAYKNRNTAVHMGQSAGGNVNKRNNAAYDYTAELGFSYLNCKSSSMSLTAGGRTLHGSFMVNARGVEISRIHPQYKDIGLRKIVIAGSGLKSMNRMRIMDYLTANLDRHAGNMFYQLDKSGTGDIRLVGVQGIDNDASFGCAEFRGKGINNRMSMLGDISIIDKEMADEILQKDYTLIESKLRLAGLSADEMEMSRERFDALKNKIQKGQIRVIDGENAWDELARPENLAKLRYKDGSKGNLFELVARNIESNNTLVDDFRAGKYKYVPLDPPVSTESSLGLSVSSDQRMNLQSHLQELQRFRDEIAGNYPESKQPVELKAVTESLGIAIGTLSGFMKSFSDEKKTALTDNERNLLRETLRTTENLSKAYLQKFDPPGIWGFNYELRRFGCNEAKNLNAYMEFAAESIERDSLEALNDKVRTQAAAIKKDADRLGEIERYFQATGDDLAAENTSPAQRGEADRRILQQIAPQTLLYLKEIAAISGKYPGDHPMQRECGKLLDGSDLARLAAQAGDAYGRTHPEGPAVQGIQALGLSEPELQAVQMIRQRAAEMQNGAQKTAELQNNAQKTVDLQSKTQMSADPVPGSETPVSVEKPEPNRVNAAEKTEKAEKTDARPEPDRKNLVAKTAEAVKTLTEINCSFEAVAGELSRGDLSAVQRKDLEDRFMNTHRQTVSRGLKDVIRMSGEFPDDHPLQSELGKFIQSKALDTILFEGVNVITKREGTARNGGVFGALGLSSEDVLGINRIVEKSRAIRESRKVPAGANRKVRAGAVKTNRGKTAIPNDRNSAGQKTKQGPGSGKFC